jgi:hypothetical protein
MSAKSITINPSAPLHISVYDYKEKLMKTLGR